ncbi:MAG: DUF4270 domain-containing protein [Bacteroidia bacterium]|nr:DUF4270 domain-containing protein [Bacteroidia bacterium]
MSAHLYKKFILPGLLIAISFLSCKKDGQVGLDTQPKTDLISTGFSDTTTLLSYVQPDDSIKTNAASLLMLGSYVDPIFGTSACSFYSQVNIYNNSTNLDFTGGIGPANELVLDSIVLTLQYMPAVTDLRKLYGVSSDPQTVKVYKITQALSSDSNYYSNRKIAYDSLNPIGTKTFIAQPDSNVVLKGIVYPPHLRIKLDSSFGANLLAQSGSANLIDNTALHNFFQGIYVASVNPTQSAGQGAIYYFDPYGVNTKLMLYYRRNISSAVAGDTLTYPFEINGSTVFFNHFYHNFTTATDSKSILPYITSASVDTDYIYVQSAAGVRTKFVLPYLMNWAKQEGPIVINKAEVLLNVDASTITSNYDVHPQLYLVAIDSTGAFNFPIDFYEVISLYGGTYTSATQQFRFNITRHIQQIIDGKRKDYGLYLLAGGGAVNAQRTVLFGAGKASNKIKFRLTYTKLY